MKLFTGIPLPRIGPTTGKRRGPPKGVKPYSQRHLNSLRDHAVPPGKVLNPSGKRGHAGYIEGVDGEGWREPAMKRARKILKEKKAIALEAHELQQIARENATLAMETLAEISGNKRAPESSRIAASAVILDRAYGKASQTSITANVTSNGKKSDLDQSELDKRIGSALKRVEELTNRTPKARPSTKRPVDIRKFN